MIATFEIEIPEMRNDIKYCLPSNFVAKFFKSVLQWIGGFFEYYPIYVSTWSRCLYSGFLVKHFSESQILNSERRTDITRARLSPELSQLSQLFQPSQPSIRPRRQNLSFSGARLSRLLSCAATRAMIFSAQLMHDSWFSWRAWAG